MTGCCVAGAAILAAAGIVLWNRWRTVQTMKRLEEMISKATDGSFTEDDFDESTLSALESQFARYLAASSGSARNLKKQKDQLAGLISDISHQTKTPVVNIGLYAELLEEQNLTPQGRDCARAIRTQSEKLQTLIEALVKSSRLETGLLVMHPEAGNLEPMLRRAAEQYRTKAAAKNIALHLGDLGAQAVFDLKWTEEAVCNLLDNAVKYTLPGGEIWLEVREYPMFSAIRVTDTGPGIPEGEIPKLFGRFYRMPEVSTQEGVGIGLHLTRQIAQNQGGYVQVDSTPGKGSTFSIFLKNNLSELSHS